MLEGVGGLREAVGLIEELGGLEVRQALLQGHRRQLGNGLQQRHGDVHAHDRSGLQETLGLRRQAVDARGQHRLHGGRELEVRQGGPGAGRLARRRALPRVLLHQGLRQLLQEEGIALRLGEERLDERGRDRSRAGALPGRPAHCPALRAVAR